PTKPLPPITPVKSLSGSTDGPKKSKVIPFQDVAWPSGPQQFPRGTKSHEATRNVFKAMSSGGSNDSKLSLALSKGSSVSSVDFKSSYLTTGRGDLRGDLTSGSTLGRSASNFSNSSSATGATTATKADKKALKAAEKQAKEREYELMRQRMQEKKLADSKKQAEAAMKTPQKKSKFALFADAVTLPML
ncbi:hypothetical protein P7C73_g1470, partial [Tremellales sp. Uapishka_1]